MGFTIPTWAPGKEEGTLTEACQATRLQVLLLWWHYFFLFGINLSKGRVTDRDRKWIFHLLVHSSKRCNNSQGWLGQAEARYFLWASHMGVGAPVLRHSSTVLPGTFLGSGMGNGATQETNQSPHGMPKLQTALHTLLHHRLIPTTRYE